MGSNVTSIGNYAGIRIGKNFASPVPAVPTAINGSFDTGPIAFQQATGWSKWVVQLIPSVAGASFSGYTATVYTSLDLFTANGTNVGSNGDWAEIPVPSNQTESPACIWTNPLTAAGQLFYSNVPLPCIRVNVVASGQAGSFFIVVFAVP